MISSILGKKIGMTQAFIKNRRVPVTVVKAGPCVITQVKKKNKDGYNAVQLGFGDKKAKNTTKPLRGHLKKVKNNNTYPRFIREIRLESTSEAKVGDEVKVSDIFSEGDDVTVTGTSKGKGFAGVVKRWGFAGGPRTHGQSDRQRAPGSIGQGTDPGRVWKGKKMAGRMGGERKTVKGLKIVSVNPKKNELMISGPIPGRPKSLVIINLVKKAKKENKNE